MADRKDRSRSPRKRKVGKNVCQRNGGIAHRTERDLPAAASIIEVVPDATGTDMPQTPWWLWPNVLSLDAPAVASLWQNLAAKDAGLSLSLASKLALPLSVWVIYLADRLMDSVRMESANPAARHLFYRSYRFTGIGLLLFASALLTGSLHFLPAVVLHNGLLVGMFVAAYLLMVHALPPAVRRYLPKELAVALIFAAGTTLSVWSRMPNPSVIVFPAVLFALLCWLNCSAIDVWECGRSHTVPLASAEWLVLNLTPVSLTLCALSLVLLAFTSCHLFLFAIAVCSLAYCWLQRARASLASDAVRVLVDVPLLIPVVLLSWR
jgi:hypothetical protein